LTEVIAVSISPAASNPNWR